MSEAVIVKEPCYFCGEEETVLFSEHFTFCPNCTAIYTDLMIIKACEHFDDSAIVVERLPYYKKYIDGKTYLTKHGNHCSVCGKTCLADGW